MKINFTLTSEVDSAQWYTKDEAKEVIYKGGLAEHFLNLSLNKI